MRQGNGIAAKLKAKSLTAIFFVVILETQSVKPILKMPTLLRSSAFALSFAELKKF